MWLKSIIGATTLVTLALAPAAVADDTGLAGMHELRREAGKYCMADHWHYGSSNGMSSRKAAELDAIKSWSSFTDFEYGSSWARWSRAASKSVSCSVSGGSWGCQIEARPCR